MRGKAVDVTQTASRCDTQTAGDERCDTQTAGDERCDTDCWWW